MTRSNAEVMELYAKQEKNRGEVDWHSGNVHAEGRRLSSYGMTIAYLIGKKGDDYIFLKNGDRSSHTTNQHIAEMQRVCNGPTIPFSALYSAGIDAERIRMDNFIEYTEDTHISLHKHSEDGEWHVGHPWTVRYNGETKHKLFVRPEAGMMICNEIYYEDDPKLWYGEWHILGGAAFRYSNPHTDEKHYYLCGLDNNAYFLVELPSCPWNITDAYEILKPDIVRFAEGKGANIQRQGEWFFIEQPEITDRDVADVCGARTLTEMRRQLRQAPLPVDGRWSNTHNVRHIQARDTFYCKGMVYHRDGFSGEASGQHPSLSLGDVWHTAYHNTALHSWAAAGGVD